MASIETMARYRAEAGEKIRRAKTRYPELRPLEALFRYVTDYPEKLTVNTTRLWRQQMRIAAAEVAREDDRDFSEAQVRDFLHAMDEAVDALRGSPSAPRTSTKKRKDASKAEVVAVFGHLKTRALELQRVRMAATAIYCVLMPRLGGRPVELVGAEVSDGVLVLPNAKRAPGQELKRQIPVGHWEFQYRVALAALIEVVNREVGENGYNAWLSVLAEILARACLAVGVSRLAPTTFRHTALSTWSAAGYTTEEIAALAGHFCGRSPSHYIRTASAWNPEDVMTVSLAPTAAILKDEADPASAFDVSPMPQPQPLPTVVDNSSSLWADHRKRMDQEERALDLAVAEAIAAWGKTPTEDQIELPESRTPGNASK